MERRVSKHRVSYSSYWLRNVKKQEVLRESLSTGFGNQLRVKAKAKVNRRKAKAKGAANKISQQHLPTEPRPRPTPAIAHHAAFARQDQRSLPFLPRPTLLMRIWQQEKRVDRFHYK
jgi:hypothetical protein